MRSCYCDYVRNTDSRGQAQNWWPTYAGAGGGGSGGEGGGGGGDGVGRAVGIC